MPISSCSSSSSSESTIRNTDAANAISLLSILNGFAYLPLSWSAMGFPEFLFQLCKTDLF